MRSVLVVVGYFLRALVGEIRFQLSEDGKKYRAKDRELRAQGWPDDRVRILEEP